LAGCC